MRIVLRDAVHVADWPRARERGHGLVGVDHANTVIVTSADDGEVLPVFDDGSDSVRIVELRFERVGVVDFGSCPVASKSTHRPVAQNDANAMVRVVAQQHVAFAVNAYASGALKSCSERVVAVHVATSTSGECADGAVVMDDTQAVLVVSPNNDPVWRVQCHANGSADCGRGCIWAVDGSTSAVACKSAHRAPPLLAAARVRRATHVVLEHSSNKGGSEHDRACAYAALATNMLPICHPH